MKILASAQEECINYAKQELINIIGIKNIKDISNNVFMFECNNDFDTISNKIIASSPIFIRYISPILFEKQIKSNFTIEDIFTNIVLNNNDIYKFYITILNNNNIDKKYILDKYFKYFEENNIILNPKEANKIISIIIKENNLYFSIVDTSKSISSWYLGEHRFKIENNQISRAEHKLLEAFDYFKINTKKYKTALDLGAAPGGWSKILLEKNLKVVAVDPAILDSRLLKNKNLSHFKSTSQEFFKRNKEHYDIIVNDMKMSPEDSLNIMYEARKYLNKNGIMITTLKLNSENLLEQASKCVDSVKRKFNFIGVHQLFNNRSECTIVFN